MDHKKKQESSRKTSTSALLTTPKPLTVWITTNSGKFFKRWEYQTSWPASWEICMQVKKQRLELDVEQRTGFKLGKYVKAVYCQCVYLTYMQSTSWGMPGWMKHRLDSQWPEKYQWPQIWRWHHPYCKKQRGAKEPLDESQRGEWKSWFKIQHSKNSDHGIWSHHFMANRWGKQWKQWQTFFSWAPKSLQMVTAASKLKDACSLEEKLWPV